MTGLSDQTWTIRGTWNTDPYLTTNGDAITTSKITIN